MSVYRLPLLEDLAQGIDTDILYSQLKILVQDQSESWGDRPVVFVQVGNSAKTFFDEIEELYNDSGLKYRKIYVPQSDELDAGRNIKIDANMLRNPDEIVCLFDNTLRTGESMAAALRDVFNAYSTGDVVFSQISTMVLRDRIGGSMYPLILTVPPETTPRRFLERRDLRCSVSAANKYAREMGKKIVFERYESQMYITLDNNGSYSTLNTLNDDEIASGINDSFADMEVPEHV